MAECFRRVSGPKIGRKLWNAVGWVERKGQAKGLPRKRNPSSFAKASSFSEAACFSIVAAAGPVVGIDAKLHHAVERRIGPVAHPAHQAVLHRVVMDVIDVGAKSSSLRTVCSQ